MTQFQQCICSLFVFLSSSMIKETLTELEISRPESMGVPCLQTRNAEGLPEFCNYGDGREISPVLTLHQQAIIPSYSFTCCGNITEWGVDVQPGGGRHNVGRNGVPYTIDFQVWRPSPTTPQDDTLGTGYYSLVGNNRFTSISLSGDVAQVTPSPQDYIQFRPGDVLGFYVEEARDDNNRVNVLTTGSFSSEVVWYASVDSQNVGGCVSAGSNGDLNTLLQGAPVISISTSSFNCPASSSSVASPTPATLITTSAGVVEPTSPTVPVVAPPSTASGIMSTSSDINITESPSPSPLPSVSVNTGLVIGLVIAVVISLVSLSLLVVIILILILKKKKTGFSTQSKDRAIDNITYEIKGAGASLKLEQNATYDYVDTDTTEAAMHQEVLSYHSTGPLPGSKPGPMKAKPPGSVGRLQDNSVLYEAPTTTPKSKFRGSSGHHESGLHSQDVFDVAGFPVPTIDERAAWEESNYELEEAQAYSKLDFFVEEKIYWAPASTTSDLYSQLASKKYREIPRSQLTTLEALGSGEFGAVSKALWTISGASRELAVKTLRPGLPEEEKVRFLQEAAIMGQFSHPNVVKLYGVVTLREPVMICIELLSNGDLRGYLSSMIPERLNSQEMERQFLKFSKQIASGMHYLSKKSFVHRDLAARNVLLDSTLTCKIGDFGMARDLMEETYYTPKTKGGKIPVKWTAPEALNYKKYSTDSDVWSYGMVLFEIWSVGKKPFSEFTNKEVVRLITSNYNQPPPPGCPRAIYKLMVDCWHPDHNKRPKFSDICDYLKAPTERLLQWAERDERTCPDGRKLGASLSTANTLYQDLQNIYK